MLRVTTSFFSVLLTTCTFFVSTHATAVSDNELHDQVNKSLVQLTVTGKASIGDNINTPVSTTGTGFFVGEGGYILTTAHLFSPLKNSLAFDTKITANVFGIQSPVEVLFISEVASLDLVLLRAFIPRGLGETVSLDVGTSKDFKPTDNDDKLLTSGWGGEEYVRDKLTFIDTTTKLVPYAWKLRGDVVGGQSGSPVYVQRDDKPLVIGVLKATAVNNETLVVMIPIENSFQLIGQFEILALQREVASLREIVGRLESSPDRPLTARIGDVEATVKELEASFDWTAELNDDGAIVVRYEKLVSDGPQIEKIKVKLSPFYYTKDDFEDNAQTVTASTTLSTSREWEQRTKLKDGVGTFVIEGMRKRLTEILEDNPEALKSPRPFQAIVVKMKAVIDDPNGSDEQVVVLKEFDVVPKADWNFK